MDSGANTSFEADIKPLFREKDRDSMRRAFDLWSYEDVKSHAEAIAEHLKNGSMPCDGAWPTEQVELFERWVQQGGWARLGGEGSILFGLHNIDYRARRGSASV